MLQELDPSVVADVTTCVLQYPELDLNVVAGVVADFFWKAYLSIEYTLSGSRPS